MTALGLSGMMFQCVSEGTLSMGDTVIERRPYHKNCKCALHKSKGGACSGAGPHQRKVAFPKKQSWSQISLCISAATSEFSSQHSLLSDTAITSTGDREIASGAHSLPHRQYMEILKTLDTILGEFE